MTVDQHQFETLMQRFPRAKGETAPDWFDRLMRTAEVENRPRMPYREPGDDDE